MTALEVLYTYPILLAAKAVKAVLPILSSSRVTVTKEPIAAVFVVPAVIVTTPKLCVDEAPLKPKTHFAWVVRIRAFGHLL